MSSKQEDENYWNHSDSKAFSFDDEDFQLGNRNKPFGSSVKSFVADIIFEGVTEKPEVLKRPLETLISRNSLRKIFGEDTITTKSNLSTEEELRIVKRQISNLWTPLSASKTIKLILLEKPYSLHLYKSLSLKKELLDEAIKSGDGNAILAVVLYLSKTLKKSLFYQILQTRPAAVSHYAQYLTARVMVSDLIDLLEMLGQPKEAAMKQFTFIVDGTSNKMTRLQRLKACYNNHFALLDSKKDKLFVEDYIHYLEWLLQLDSSTLKDLEESSVLSSLDYLCRNHWDEQRTNKLSPWFLANQQNISEHQFQWVILKSRASIQSWNDVEAYFLMKGWIGGKKLKGIIPVEKIILELCKNGAPYSILEKYFEVISSYEKRLEIAKQMLCHKAVIDTYVLMKDRQGIMDYKMNLKPQSEEYLHAELILRSPVKWKN